MSDIVKFNENQRVAIEAVSRNPSATNREIADFVGVHCDTVRIWRTNPDFIDAVYDRFMELEGSKLPMVVGAMVHEAIQGNVQAGRLVLEHFGKLIKRMEYKIESPFEKFLRAEDAIFEEVSTVRNPINDFPTKRVKDEKKRLNTVTKAEYRKSKRKQYSDKNREKIRKQQKERQELRERAIKVGLELLPPKRVKKHIREAWINKLEELEAKTTQNS